MTEERRIILQMLSDGKLTVEEVTALLDALEQGGGGSGGQTATEDSAAAKAKEYFEKSRDKVEEGIQKIRQVVREKGPTADDVDHVVKQVQRGINRVLDELPNVMSRLRRIDFQPGPQHRFQHSFAGSVTPATPAVLRVHVGNGDVIVTSGDKGDYRVDVETIVYVEDEIEARYVNTQAVRWQSTADGFDLDVDDQVGCIVRITLPRHGRYDAEITSGDGALSWRNTDAQQLRLLTGDGPIHITNCTAAHVLVQTNDGPIKINGVRSGPLTAATGDGPIHYDGFADHLRCKTGDGPIRARVLQPGPANSATPHIDLHSNDGPIRLTLPTAPAIGHRLDLTTGDGPIDVSLPGMQVMDINEPSQTFTGESEQYENKDIRIQVHVLTKDGPIRISGENGAG